MNTSKELQNLFDDLQMNAYNSDYHTYYYKDANQIIRKHFERFEKQIKGDSPCAVANKWRYREFIVSEKTNTDPTVYQFILDRNGVALLFTDEFTNIEGSSILIKREIIEDMVNKLNIVEQATVSL